MFEIEIGNEFLNGVYHFYKVVSLENGGKKFWSWMFTAFTDLIEQMLKYTFYENSVISSIFLRNYSPELTQEKMNLKLLQS